MRIAVIVLGRDRRAGQAEAVRELRAGAKLGALPEFAAQGETGRERISLHRLGLHAVLPTIGEGKSGMALFDDGGLAAQQPAGGQPRLGRCRRGEEGTSAGHGQDI